MDNIQLDYLKLLNPEQLTAVTYPPEQSLLVLAGAGSGKTRVLTSRILWLLSTEQSLPQNILAVTFTNKAAKEMRSRIMQQIPLHIDDMWLGTFHSICHRILRKFHQAAQLKNNFQLIDTQDQLSIAKRLLKNNNIFNNSITPKELINYINSNKEKGYRSNHPQMKLNKNYPLLNHFYEAYELICLQENLVDFSELLLKCVETLQNQPEIKDYLQNRFHHILVDEFQDTNNLQYEWLKLTKGKKTTLFAVGDDDQSIYSFRGANVKNMQNIIRDFKITKPLKLEQNYRSTKIILAAANHIISLNKNRIGKNLKSTQKKGELIKYIRTYSEVEESQFIADEIKSLHHNGHSYQDIGILYRNNAQSRNIEQALFNTGVPYKVYGGLRFYEREEIKHALAYLRLLVNPEDNHSFLRIINFPNRGIGIKTIEFLQNIAEQNKISLWDSLLQEKANNKNLASFFMLINQLQNQINQLTFSDLINELIHATGLIDYYQHKKGNFQNKIDNLHELINAAYTFHDTVSQEQSSTTQEKIISFLSNASLEAGERDYDNSIQTNECVQLMTIHTAKGLEFDTVFLIALEEGLFPSEYAIPNHENLEEERRLMYVATTRAKKNLYLSSTYERYYQGRRKIVVESRFINEIPKNLIHYLSTETNLTLHPKISSNEKKIGPSTETLLKKVKNDPYCLGSIVRHPNFGTGVIINKQPKTQSYLLTINFGKMGIKILDSAFANIEMIDLK